MGVGLSSGIGPIIGFVWPISILQKLATPFKSGSLRLRLVTCKLFSKCKIFSGKNIYRKGKYFQVFDCILKIVLKNIFKCLVTF